MLNLKTNFEIFDIKNSELTQLNDHTFYIKKWHWDYRDCLRFQKFCVSKVQENAYLKFYICCNHPRTLTHGRGLQKPKKGEHLDLIDFDPKNFPHLPFPFYKIERGGGLTFHHPGQFIFYPILKLNPGKLSLSKMTKDIFQFSLDILSSWGMENLSSENKLLGLWQSEKKLASMGIAIEKLVTFHGMALNFFEDKEMMDSISSLNPCGLKSNIYTSIDKFIKLKNTSIEDFTLLFIEKVYHAWK